MKTEIIINTIFAVLFFALFVVTLVGIICGAWWHIGTAAVAWLMFILFGKEIRKCRAED